MIIECPRCKSRYDATLKRPGSHISCRCGQVFYAPKLPSLAKSSNCPSCGGTASPDQQKCEYCGVYLSFSRCPACFSVAPYQGAKYCAECGDSLTQPAKPAIESNRKFPCPRCAKIDLERKKIGDYTIDSCIQCSGIWLNHSVLDQLLAQSNTQKSSQSILGKTPVKPTELEHHDISYLPCPECDVLMNRRNFANKSWIIVDECNAHGIWFDKHELAAGIQFLRSMPKNVQHPTPEQIKHLHKVPLKKEITSKQDEVIDITPEDLLTLINDFPQFFS